MNLFTSLEAGDICEPSTRPTSSVPAATCSSNTASCSRAEARCSCISTTFLPPKPYTDFYFKNHLYWNEQYMLQAFLTYNSRFEVIWPGTFMYMKHPDRLAKVWPEIQAMRAKYPLAEPSSFWLRVRPAGK